MGRSLLDSDIAFVDHNHARRARIGIGQRLSKRARCRKQRGAGQKGEPANHPPPFSQVGRNSESCGT